MLLFPIRSQKIITLSRYKPHSLSINTMGNHNCYLPKLVYRSVLYLGICCLWVCVENERMITILTTFQFSHFAFYSSLSTYARNNPGATRSFTLRDHWEENSSGFLFAVCSQFLKLKELRQKTNSFSLLIRISCW